MKDSRRRRVIEGCLDRPAGIGAASVTVVGHLYSVVHGPLQGGDDVTPGAAAAGTQHLEAIEICPGRYPDYADAVILGGDGAGHVGAVAVVVHGIEVVVDEVIATGIVPVQIRVGVIDPGVDDCHLHSGALVGVIVNGSGADMLDAPGVVQLGVDDVDLAVEVDGGHVGIGQQPGYGRFRNRCRNSRHQVVGVLDRSASLSHQSLFWWPRLLVEADDDGHPGGSRGSNSATRRDERERDRCCQYPFQAPSTHSPEI